MAKEGGEAAGRPAGAGLRRVTHHDEIISSARHWRYHCCYMTTDTFISLIFADIITICVISALLLFISIGGRSNLSMLKDLFTMVRTVAWYRV